MKRVTLKWFNENLSTLLQTKEKITYYCIHENTEINYGNANDVDLDYCKEHNIDTFQMLRDGGCIVCSAGNVGITHFSNVSEGWVCDKFSFAFIDYLKSKGIENIETSNNDILIDGYKVASSVEKRILGNMDWIYSTFQISINQDIETIKNVCKKPMIKVPKALSDYGITTEDIVEFCEEYFK